MQNRFFGNGTAIFGFVANFSTERMSLVGRGSGMLKSLLRPPERMEKRKAKSSAAATVGQVLSVTLPSTRLAML